MLTPRQLDLVEALFELEPESTYPQRAAALVAELAGAAGYRLSLDGSDSRTADIRRGAPSSGEGLAVALAHGKQSLGKLHLYATDGSGRLGDDKVKLARWGGRLAARGLHAVRRGASQRGTIDVKSLLDGTPLTPRERDVVGRLVSGASTREIAEATDLTVSTVNTYMKRIFAKLGVHSRVELLARVTGTHATKRAVG